MTSEYLYHHSGLSIASEIPIPEWAAFEVEDGQPIDVRFLASPLSLLDASEPAFEISPCEYRFSVPGIGRYYVTQDTVIVDAEPGADARTVRVFLLGSCMGALYYLRDLMCLHASVVQTPRGAIAFCGPSGAGKSTLAAHLTARGCSLICDDLCRVSFTDEGQAFVYPSSSRLKLWSEALEALGWSLESLARDHIRMDKYHVPLEVSHQIAPIPLVGIYLPVWGELQTTRVTGINALKRFMAAGAYRAELLEPMARLPLLWDRFTRIARSAPIFELSRPRDLSKMHEVCDALLAEQHKSR